MPNLRTHESTRVSNKLCELRQRQKFYWSLLLRFVSSAHVERDEKSSFLCSAVHHRIHTCGSECWAIWERGLCSSGRGNFFLLALTPLKQRLNFSTSYVRAKRFCVCVCTSTRNLDFRILNATLFFLSLFFAGYFWQITDLHFDSAYSTKGDIVRSRF